MYFYGWRVESAPVGESEGCTPIIWGESGECASISDSGYSKGLSPNLFLNNLMYLLLLFLLWLSANSSLKSRSLVRQPSTAQSTCLRGEYGTKWVGEGYIVNTGFMHVHAKPLAFRLQGCFRGQL